MIFADPKLRKKIKKVLLINLHGKIMITEEGSRERKLAVPPLGLAYLAAAITGIKIDVEVLDILIEGYDQETSKNNVVVYGLNNAQIKERIDASQADMVGISCLFSNRGKEALDVCRMVREVSPFAHIAAGGQHFSGITELIKRQELDYILVGEADNSFVDLINAINQQDDLTKVDGIVLYRGKQIWQTPKKCFPNVCKLPYPQWELFSLEKYWATGVIDYELSDHAKKFMTMVTSRGCPHNCYFCTKSLMSGRRYRERDVEDVLNEIKLYWQTYDLKKIYFWDDNFFVNKNRVKILLTQLYNRFPGFRFQVTSGTEVNALDDEVIDLMGKAGFDKVFLAIETVNQELQDRLIDKKVSIARIKELVIKIKSAGIVAEGSFMVGFPGETKAQMDATFEMATKLGLDRISISIVNPLPGTMLYDQCAREGLFFPDFDGENIRWSMENIRLDAVPRGYIAQKRREVWESYMKERIDIQTYETQGFSHSQNK
jgi:magnesium-protoporphyrin IX monomethyl ester (oxidative) cyclase